MRIRAQHSLVVTYLDSQCSQVYSLGAILVKKGQLIPSKWKINSSVRVRVHSKHKNTEKKLSWFVTTLPSALFDITTQSLGDLVQSMYIILYTQQRNDNE